MAKELNFARFGSSEEAERALERLYPRFDHAHYQSYPSAEAAEAAYRARRGEADALLRYLKWIAGPPPGFGPIPGHKGRTMRNGVYGKVVWVHPRHPLPPNMARGPVSVEEERAWEERRIPKEDWIRAYAYLAIIPDADARWPRHFWQVWLAVSADGVLLDYEVRLTYFGRDFSEFEGPLRMVDIVDAGPWWICPALLSRLPKSITPQAVDRVMREAGADSWTVETIGQQRGSGGSREHIYYFEKAESRFLTAFDIERLVVVSWRFDQKGTFQNVFIDGYTFDAECEILDMPHHTGIRYSRPDPWAGTSEGR